MSLTAEFITSLDSVPADSWNNISGTDYPFTRHEFLYGLERSDCTTADTGWQPCHLLLRDETGLQALLPTYLKSHSYGEYVFDWSWADAWRRSGLQYYPKLVSAIPFTPATGPRLLTRAGVDAAAVWGAALQAIARFARRQDISSWHLLFPAEEVSRQLVQQGLHQRVATQFHWFNQGYRSFDDFLAGFTSRKRKSLRRERSRVTEQGLSLRTLQGAEIGPLQWRQFHRFYQLTYAKRSGHGGYLTETFFTEVAPALGEQVVMVLAYLGERAVAGALYFRSSDTLYGRYWGCEREYDCLHFEACYYQGIEYCIANGLQRFDPGAQGEHKIQRGFRPVPTFSNHWIADPRLSAAVGDFTHSEADHNAAYMQAAAGMLPFRSE
ncbi:MAG: N-acetyltransferase [Pseudomonadales bacterium]|nr:N-acetyltransferase [Pseudomonadales bacterium]